MKHRFDTQISDFKCKHCHGYVSTAPMLSGVGNRNHCPYCLWSRHMDLLEAGDRLAACKAEMEPIGLSLKRTVKKYGTSQGELLVIHRCTDCRRISVNRMAADDDAGTLLGIYQGSLSIRGEERRAIEASGIQVLGRGEEALIHTRLFGRV